MGEPSSAEIRELAGTVREQGLDALADWLEEGAEQREKAGASG